MSYDKTEVLNAMRGKWPSVLFDNCGWSRDHFNEKKHTSCPICGGRDRFRWGHSKAKQREEGFAWCNQCGSHDGIFWYQKATGLNFFEAIQELGDWLGGMTVQQRDNVAKASKAIAKTVERPTVRMPPERAEDLLSRPAKEGFVYLPCFEVVEGEPQDRPCNVARVAKDYSVVFAAGHLFPTAPTTFSWGSFTPINPKTDGSPVYLIEDIDIGIEIASRHDREVWVAWGMLNVLEVSSRYAGERELRLVTVDADDCALFNPEATGRPSWGIGCLLYG